MSETCLKARLTVIGGGGAGLCAAVTAMQNGVRDIVVLEKSHFIGGNSRMAGGHLFGAPTQEEQDEAFRRLLRGNHYKVEPKNLRAFIENASGTIEFFKSIGIGYHPGFDQNMNVMDADKHPFGNFVKATRRMTELLLEGGNTVLKDTGVTGIQRDAEGRVCRVLAETADGDTVIVDTEAAVITTGGFGGNSELLHKYFPNEYSDNFHRDALPLDGSGIDVARSAGAKLNDYAVIIKENAYSCDSYNGAPNRAAHNPMSLWVNKLGQRFADESYTRNESSNALVRQPDMIGYALFDTAVMERTPELDMGPFAHDPRPELEAERRRGDEWVCIAEDLDTIARWMGCKPEELKASVDEYNEDCDKGRDRWFCKDPKFLVPLRKAPFYAIKFRPIIIDTIGPIVVNERMQVLGQDSRPIPGLYAAGVCTAGWQGNDCHPMGWALGYSTTSGRIAGKSIAEYLQ